MKATKAPSGEMSKEPVKGNSEPAAWTPRRGQAPAPGVVDGNVWRIDRIWKMRSEGGAAVQVTPTPGSVSVESPDGRYLYDTETTARPSALWRLPFAGGPPVKLLDGVVLGAFALVDAGIYYLDRPTRDRGAFVFDRPSTESRLWYFDFATRQSTTVVGNLGTVGFGLTASRDGGTVFFPRLDSVFDELMLMDDFR